MAAGNRAAQPHRTAGSARPAFAPGTLVVVSLANPREKFWGALLKLLPAGLSVRGIDLSSFDDFVALLRAGEAVSPSEIFFPMHRVERVEADLRNGSIPSTAERFLAAAGQSPTVLLGRPQSRSVPRR